MDVLIAHGSAGSRRALVQALSERGYEVVEACDGPETLDVLLELDSPRLAIMDWDLPGLDGPEICRLVWRYRLARTAEPVNAATAAPAIDATSVTV